MEDLGDSWWLWTYILSSSFHWRGGPSLIYQWCCLYLTIFGTVFLIWLSMFLLNSCILTSVTLWHCFLDLHVRNYMPFIDRYLNVVLVVLDTWDSCVYSGLLFHPDIRCICITFDPSKVLIWIHSDVYLKNVILLLERWNKIMFFFPRKKNTKCLLL